MTAERSGVCRLCFDTVADNDGEVIEEDLGGMLQTVLIKIDLTISASPVICNKCREKLVANYNFKRTCVFTEDGLTPFVSENVKLNLKEVRSQIIKSEDTEDEKNVCRLCLQFIDNDMTLSDSEKEQFQQFFPEIDLSRTNFVIVCSTCYDRLHKYFIFAMSCLDLEQQLHNYSLDQTENKIDITEEQVAIKLEHFQAFIKREEDKKEVIFNEDEELALNEELHIKCDAEEEDDERFETNNQDIEQFPLTKEEDTNSDIDSDERLTDQEEMNISETSEAFISNQCKRCGRKFKYKGSLTYHTLAIHTDPSKMTLYSCEQCHKKFNHMTILKRHILNVHTKIRWCHCELCSKTFKSEGNLKNHIFNVHTDSSKISWYHCEQCDKKFKHGYDLKTHVRDIHTDPSKITWHSCVQCDKMFKKQQILKNHILNIHTDPSKIIWHQCDSCSQKFKTKGTLKSHILNVHADPFTATWYQCECCSKKFKSKRSLKKHANPKYQCIQCNKKFTSNPILQRHVLDIHTDSSKMTWYRCEQCDKQFKHYYNLKNHILNMHADSSKITWYYCELCSQKFKCKGNLKKHMLNVHTDPSKISWYQCEQCDKQFKHNYILRRHIVNIHTDPSEITWYQCKQCDKKFKHNNVLQKHLKDIHTDPSKVN